MCVRTCVFNICAHLKARVQNLNPSTHVHYLFFLRWHGQFMKRKQEAELRQALEEKQQKVIDDSHWVLATADDVVNEYVSIYGESLTLSRIYIHTHSLSLCMYVRLYVCAIQSNLYTSKFCICFFFFTVSVLCI